MLAAGGCASELDTSYGTTTAYWLSTSVNGVDVLSGVFTAAGHDVLTRRVIVTSAMANVQTVVWFPDDFAAPSEEACRWFDQWLAADPKRTLIYVGRNFDAAPTYWTKMVSRDAAKQKEFYRRARGSAAGLQFRAGRPKEDELECLWFAIGRGAPHAAEDLSGPWMQGIEPAKAEIEVSDTLKPVGRSRRLLSSDNGPIVWRRVNFGPDQGKLIVVANGSFLLNAMLVNHEHRKLAGKVVAAAGPAGRLVLLESGPGGPPIDPPAGGSALARLFGAWPLNVILLQLAVLGIIFCFARWPIFGRPKTPPEATNSDFGMHVDAVGRLLARAHDRSYAVARLPENVDAAKADAAGANVNPMI